MSNERRGQHPRSQGSGIPIEFVTEPGGVRKPKVYLDKSHPEVSRQWCYERNRGFGPEDFSYGSKVSAWWKCPENELHIWRRTIKDRCINKSGCPYCAGKYVSPESSLASVDPRIARELAVDLNEGLTPFDVTRGTHRKVWWRCSKNEQHIWQTTVKGRVHGRNCPHCRDERKLDLRKFPKVLRFFDRAKNADIDPYSFSTKLAVWWRCSRAKNHCWRARFTKRSLQIQCPHCATLAYRFPKLAEQLHPRKNTKATLEKISYGSNKEVWWRCSKNPRHSWLESPKARVKKRNHDDCPFCRT